ncbi:MAG: diguanylate cyclase [Magnetococcales bacterium]|nr:diguanylate cyclase [Magnetococcales bacterium]
MDEVNRQKVQEKLEAARHSYAAKLPAKLDEIDAQWHALADDAWDEERFGLLHRMVHTICGSAGTFGLPEVSQTARTAEIRLKAVLAGGTGLDKESVTAIGKDLAALRGVCEEALQARTTHEAQHMTNQVESLPSSVSDAISAMQVYLVVVEAEWSRQLKVQLAYYGYQVKTFQTLGAFRNALRVADPAMVIMDMKMPDGRGCKAMEILQKGRRAPLPVIFLSDHDDMTARLDAARAGSVAFFQKPVPSAPIIDALDACITVQEQEQYRVLIVEDSKSLAEHFSLVLQEADMETQVVVDPMTVLSAMGTFQPDLILMDLYMPGCTGLEAAAVIRQQEAFHSVPIVYLSAETDIDRQMAALDLGGDDFLTKPIRNDHLVAAVRARIKRARMLRDLMMRDGLTGLFNHTTTKERLIQELDRAKRQSTSLAFAMVDIDHFKAVNDTYGHPTGDRVIKSLARLLRQRLRKSDIVGRFGGEEFAVILLDTDGPTAVKLLDEMRDVFARVEHREGDAVFTKSFSCGVAFFPDHDDPTTLNDVADQALYQAKEGGRNRVVAWQGGKN